MKKKVDEEISFCVTLTDREWMVVGFILVQFLERATGKRPAGLAEALEDMEYIMAMSQLYISIGGVAGVKRIGETLIERRREVIGGMN